MDSLGNPIIYIIIYISCKSIALTSDLMGPATLLPLTTFLLYSAPSVPDSSKAHLKYLNAEMCSKQIPSTWTSHSNPSSPFSTITLLLSTLSFSPLLHTSANYPTIAPRSSSNLPHRTKSCAYKRPGNLHSPPSSRNLTPFLPIPIPSYFIFIFIFVYMVMVLL